MASIGELIESQGEITVDWKIKDFSTLSQETDIRYESPKFYFSGASWQIVVFPNGDTQEKSDSWIGLYIQRMSTGSAVKLNYRLTLRTIDEKIGQDVTGLSEFNFKTLGWGVPKMALRSTVTEKITNSTVPNVLIATCSLKNSEPHNLAGSLFSRHQTLSDNLKEIYEKRKNIDCILNVDGVNLSAHRMILESRSPVFRAMFNHDTKENQTGEIYIDDIEKSTMETLLIHMYTGDIDNPTTENVLSLYSAAEKYDIKEVKDNCLEFIIRNLSEDWVCDVIQFNELYQDECISRCARDYFKKNVRKILTTEKWKTFAKENPTISIELLSSVVTFSFPEQSSSEKLVY